MRAAALFGLLSIFGGALAAATPGNRPGSCVANPDHPFESEYDLGACTECSADGSICVACWDMFSLDSRGQCVQCNQSWCMACDGDNPDFCLTCGDWSGEAEKGFYATEEGTCEECPADYCMECLNYNGTCVGCQTGMGAVDGTCQPCTDTEGCVFCNGDLDVCEECMSGYLLDGSTGTCLACPSDCDECSDTDTCIECSYGYALDKDSQCVKCPEGCTTCSTPTLCNSCDIGYTNMTGGTCAKCTDEHCTTCTPDNPGVCEICAYTAPGPWWGGPDEDGKCVRCAMEHCDACQSSYKQCDWCEDGYFNDQEQGLCTPCKGEHCTSCGLDATEGGSGRETCFGCEDGWEPDPNSPEGTCIPASSRK